MGGVHTKFSPSTFARVAACLGSVAMCQTVPESKPTIYAAEGTVFHRLIALCLRYGFDPIDFLGIVAKADGFEIEVEQDMVDHMEGGLARVRKELPKNLVIETRVSLDKWLPDQSGTCDLGAYDSKWIDVWDWKYGAGVPVHPFQNWQIVLYALGFWNDVARFETKARKFRLWIDQPRNSAGGGYWDVDLDELLEWGKRASRIIERAMKPNAPLTPGEKQCAFCPAKWSCPAYDKFATETMSLKFEDLSGKDKPPVPQKMTMRQKAYIAKHAGFLKEWIDTQHKAVLDAALKGDDTFMVKAVYGRAPNRKWADQEEAESILARKVTNAPIFKRVLISPAKAQELLLAEDYDDLVARGIVITGTPKPVLVPVEDNRPAIDTVASKFDDETGARNGKKSKR